MTFTKCIVRSVFYRFFEKDRIFWRSIFFTQGDFCSELKSELNGKKIIRIGLVELEKHSFKVFTLISWFPRYRCTWVSCQPMILTVLGSVNTMVKTESSYCQLFSSFPSAKEGRFWQKSMLTPLKNLWTYPSARADRVMSHKLRLASHNLWRIVWK